MTGKQLGEEFAKRLKKYNVTVFISALKYKMTRLVKDGRKILTKISLNIYLYLFSTTDDQDSVLGKLQNAGPML